MKGYRTINWLLLCLFLSGEIVGSVSAVEKAIGLAEAFQDLPDDMKTPRRYALVVGVGQYQDERIPHLTPCGNDAERIYELLVDPAAGMFEPEDVILLKNEAVSRVRVVEALDRLGQRAGKDDLVFIFFSGHGAMDERDRSYWVMHNTQIDGLRATALSETEITDLLGEIKTTRLVLLIDACYSASTAQLGRAKSLVYLQKVYPKFQGDGRVAITASRGDQPSVVISDENHPGHGHSVFTWHVIEGMEGQADSDTDGVITVDELWDHVKDRTANTARQQGGSQEPQLKGQIGSRFLLTVDAERFIESSAKRRELKKQLKLLFIDDAIGPEHYLEAERLFKQPDERLTEVQRKRRKVYIDLCTGRLAPDYLEGALEGFSDVPEVTPPSIPQPANTWEKETVAQREQEAQERAARQRQDTIDRLLATAKINDTPAEGRQALATLEELFELEPEHVEARTLYEKIKGYYGPEPNDVMTNSIDMELVWIPPGEFRMGSNKGERDERPVHKVQLTQGFWVGRYEVTQDQYRAITGKSPSYHKPRPVRRGVLGLGGKKQGKSTGNYPVEQVSWTDATAFCEALSRREGKTYRLPTEAEWEYACRAGSTTEYYFGDDVTILTQHANYARTPRARGTTTKEVGSFSSNAFGLYDMHGNVFEWVRDRYDPAYYKKSPTQDPQGPDKGSHRVYRGGGWKYDGSRCRSADRGIESPAYRQHSVGFRIVLEPPAR